MKYILTLTLFFSAVSATSSMLAEPEDADSRIISAALKKFEREYTPTENFNHTSPAAPFHRFYLCTVLMHIRFENYASSYLEGRAPLNHILGLAYAFAPYKSYVQSKNHGFTECNSRFLTAVLKSQREAYLAQRSHQVSALESRPSS